MPAIAYDAYAPTLPAAHLVPTRQPLTVMLDMIEAGAELLDRDHMICRMEFDLADWYRIIRDAPRNGGAANPAFIPGATPPPDDAYWLRVEHRDGRIAAIMAGRYLATYQGFYDYIRDGNLWWPERKPLPVIPQEPGPSGLLAHTGGMWVSPDFAGMGLSWLVPRINHALAAARWDLDWVFGIVFQTLIDKGVAANYGEESRDLMLDAPFGPDGQRLVMYALPSSRNHLIARSSADLAQIRSEKDKKMRDFAPFAKRKN